jgi:hypothetical protein
MKWYRIITRPLRWLGRQVRQAAGAGPEHDLERAVAAEFLSRFRRSDDARQLWRWWRRKSDDLRAAVTAQGLDALDLLARIDGALRALCGAGDGDGEVNS